MKKNFRLSSLKWVAVVDVVVLAIVGLFAITPTTRAADPALQGLILKIVVDDTIHPITEEYIGRAIDSARTQHADAVLIELSTPGGLLSSTRGIVEKILASRAPVIIYVAPSGARAASAGFYILESADIAAMAPGTNTGAAHPVTITGSTPDKVMSEKIENDTAAFLRAYASKRGRNVTLAETAVRQSKSFTDDEALNQHLIDVVAKDEADLLRQVDGRTLTRFDGTKVTLHVAHAEVRYVPETLKQRIIGYMMDPNIAFIILAIGALAIYAEFNHPGAVIPGVVGLIFVILAVIALNLLPTRYAALLLIVAAFVLFALEAKFATHGVLGIGGIVALTLGGLMLVDGPIPEMRVHLWTSLAVSIPLGAITVFLMTLVVRARRRKAMTGVSALIGEIGVAQTPLIPEGKVFVQGEIWNAVSALEIGVGEQVRVRAVNGLTLEVEPVRTAVSSSPFTVHS